MFLCDLKFVSVHIWLAMITWLGMYVVLTRLFLLYFCYLMWKNIFHTQKSKESFPTKYSKTASCTTEQAVWLSFSFPSNKLPTQDVKCFLQFLVLAVPLIVIDNTTNSFYLYCTKSSYCQCLVSIKIQVSIFLPCSVLCGASIFMFCNFFGSTLELMM